MAHVRCVALLLLCLLPQDGATPRQKPSGDLALLQGKWQARIRTPNPNVMMTLLMTIQGNDVTWVTIDKLTDEDHVYTAKLKLDERATPKTWDMVEFQSQGQRAPDMPAIYKLGDDEVTLSTPLRPGDPRPTEFIEDTGQGPPRTLVFRRLSPDSDSKPEPSKDR